MKSHLKESSSNEQGTDADSIANKIATLRAQMFKGGTQGTASEGHEDGCNLTANKSEHKGYQEDKAMGAYCKMGKHQSQSPQSRSGIYRRNPYQLKTRETTEVDSREG